MEDMLRETDVSATASVSATAIGNETAIGSEIAEALGELLQEHKGADIVVLDLREQGAWTDYFVIATASSDTHLDGLERHIKNFCGEREIEILRRSRRPNVREDEWRIIDLGPIVIHLMSCKARAFYELERLYSQALMKPPLPAANYSSSYSYSSSSSS